jgi:glutaredoxin
MFKKLKDNNIVNIICGVLLIILIIILIICLVRKNDNFSNQKENGKNDNDSVCFLIVRDGCGFAKRAHEQFKKNGMRLGNKTIQVIDLSEVSSKLGDEINSKVGGATPALVCNNKVILGLKPHDQYLKDVSEESGEDNDSNNNNNSSGKDILLIGNMGCQFCLKAKKLMDELGLDYKFVESNSDLGKGYMNEKSARGVPLIIYSNGHISGFNEPEIRNLKN